MINQNFNKWLWRNWLAIAVLILFSSLLFVKCNDNNRLKKNIDALNGKMQIYQNQLGTETYVNSNLLLANDELKKQILQKNDTIQLLAKGFHKIKQITKIKTDLKIDTVYIRFENPTPCAFVREDSIAKAWYSFKYKIDSTGFRIDNFKIPNETIIISGIKRKWFLGKETIVTEVTNTNPYLSVSELKSYETVIPKKWYDNKLIYIGLGIITGALIIH